MLTSLPQEAGLTTPSFCHLHLRLLLAEQKIFLIWRNCFFPSLFLQDNLSFFFLLSFFFFKLNLLLLKAEAFVSKAWKESLCLVPCHKPPVRQKHRLSYYLLKWGVMGGRKRRKQGSNHDIQVVRNIIQPKHMPPLTSSMRLGHPVCVGEYHLTPSSHIS